MNKYLYKCNFRYNTLLFTSCLLFQLSCSNSQNTISDINHIIHIGQSLGAGEHSLPIVTDLVTGYGNIRFKMGTHTWKRGYHEDQPSLRRKSDFEFVPLTAVERGHEGETIGNGLCDHLKNTSQYFFNNDFKFLFSFTGEGGRLIRELDKIHDDAKDPRALDRRGKGGYYKTILDDVWRAKLNADAKKKSYAVFAITWMQGEANRLGHINRWDKPVLDSTQLKALYINDLVQLKKDLQKDICNITHQKDSVPFFLYQTAGTSIGMAQLKACEQEKSMYMVSPTYMLSNATNSRVWHTMKHGDALHLTADGERWLGELFAKVMRKVMFENIKWKPLSPISSEFTSDRKKVLVKFHVPNPPLVLDSLFLPKQSSGFGFEIYDHTTTYKITSVKVLANDIVEISLNESLKNDGSYYVRYGLNSVVGNVSKPIFNISPKDSIIKNVRYTAIEFEGNIMNEFAIIANEGSFILGNNGNITSEEVTSIVVRKVYLNARGNTILLAEKADLRKNVPFKTGQKCYLLREYDYGNLRDSDQELSTFTFKDKTYGNRYGQHYPLFNWSVVFDGLNINQISK